MSKSPDIVIDTYQKSAYSNGGACIQIDSSDGSKDDGIVATVGSKLKEPEFLISDSSDNDVTSIDLSTQTSSSSIAPSQLPLFSPLDGQSQNEAKVYRFK